MNNNYHSVIASNKIKHNYTFSVFLYGIVFFLLFLIHWNIEKINAQPAGVPAGAIGEWFDITPENYLLENSTVYGGPRSVPAGPIEVISGSDGYTTIYQNANGETVTHVCSCWAGCCGSKPSTPQATQGERFTQGETIDTCFLPGTQVTMGDGSKKNIEEVKVGETVLSMDPTEKVPRAATVLELQSPVAPNYYRVSLENGTVIRVTAEHPFCNPLIRRHPPTDG